MNITLQDLLNALSDLPKEARNMKLVDVCGCVCDKKLGIDSTVCETKTEEGVAEELKHIIVPCNRDDAMVDDFGKRRIINEEKKAENKPQYIFYSMLPKEDRISNRNEIYDFLSMLDEFYPGFIFWYNRLFQKDNTLMPEREIVLCKYKEKLAAVMILKKSEEEKKICTLRVDYEYQMQGIGTNLISIAQDWLDETKPFLTVEMERKHQFESLFKKFSFVEGKTEDGNVYYNEP